MIARRKDHWRNKADPALWDRRVDAEDYSVSTVQNPPFISIRDSRGNENLMEPGHDR